jgi:hypothetical protein
MTNISETQNATCRKVEKHVTNYSAGEVTKASGSTVLLCFIDVCPKQLSRVRLRFLVSRSRLETLPLLERAESSMKI